MGINAYAVREGAALRGDRAKFKRFADRVFTINVISTVASYVVFSIVILIVPKFQAYFALLAAILSLQILDLFR